VAGTAQSPTKSNSTSLQALTAEALLVPPVPEVLMIGKEIRSA